MRVLVVGLGRMGRFHVRRLPDAYTRLHPSPEARDELLVGTVETAGHGHYRGLSDALEMRWDAAIVAVPISELADVALELVYAGVPTLVEKPGAQTADEAAEIARVAAEAGVMVGVGWIERFNRAAVALHEALPLVGAVERIESLRIGPTGGADATIDLAVHSLDLASASGLRDVPHECLARYEPHRKERRFIVHGADASLEADLRREELYLWSGGEQTRITLAPSSMDSLTRELRMFLGAVEAGEQFPATMAAAVDVIRAAHELVSA
jgi:predicted dehydrogenase